MYYFLRELAYNDDTDTWMEDEWGMQLNEAVGRRIEELLDERNMTPYQLFKKTGVPKSTIGNLINCTYPSTKLRVIHELCQGFEIDLCDFFISPLFKETNLEP